MFKYSFSLTIKINIKPILYIDISLTEKIYIAYNKNTSNGYFEGLISTFNEKAKKSHWNIHIVPNEYFNSNSFNDEEYHSQLSVFFNNQTRNQFDLVIFENSYLTNFSDHLQNLKLYISKENINKYLTETGRKISTFNNHIYILVI